MPTSLGGGGDERESVAGAGSRGAGGDPAAAGRRPGGGNGRPRPLPDRVVVFLGVADDARSRVAAALLAHRSKGRVGAVSASQLAVEPDPAVAAALAEVGVDLARVVTQPASTALLEAAELVVVMGYDPRVPADGPPTEDWWIDDPRGKDADAVRCIRDALDRRVQRLLIRMGVALPTRPD